MGSLSLQRARNRVRDAIAQRTEAPGGAGPDADVLFETIEALLARSTDSKALNEVAAQIATDPDALDIPGGVPEKYRDTDDDPDEDNAVATDGGKRADGDGDSDRVWIIVEDDVGKMSRILRVFDNPDAANEYVDDPDNAGHLFVVQETVESEYEPDRG